MAAPGENRSAAQGRRSFPWEQLPEAARRQIETAMLVCFGIGFVAGSVAAALWMLLR